MADFQRTSFVERDTEQAITALKKGSHLLKYGRRGKPKFCPFRLSADESSLIWYYGKDEKQLDLRQVSRIIPGQRTAIFQRYPRPEKEYQSFSLIYNDRSLDLICKDKEEAEVWFVGLKALIARGSFKKPRNETTASTESPRSCSRISRTSSSFCPDHGDAQRSENASHGRLGKAFSDVLSYTAPSFKNPQLTDSVSSASVSPLVGPAENYRNSGAETVRVSLSSGVSSSSQGSCNEDCENLGDVFIWGEGTCGGVLGGGVVKVEKSSSKLDALVPKALESTGALDIQNISCGRKHAVLVTKQGEIYSWGEELGGRLGHGVEADVFHPKLVENLKGKSIEMAACGDFHTCAVSLSGDLYTWGDGSLNLLGHGNEASHWVPKKVGGPILGLQVASVTCGPWHTALLTSAGQLFTFGDGTFGALGHGDRSIASVPREVEALKGLQTVTVSCGVWHTAAVVEEASQSSRASAGKVYTWGDGERGKLGHGDCESRLLPERVEALAGMDFSRIACGSNLTVALATSGKVFSMGNAMGPVCVEGIGDSVEEIACGSHHVVVLTSKSEVYTWGNGGNGQLGHGNNVDMPKPTLVSFLKEKHVKSIACGSNFTAVICLHKWISSADNSVCSGCQNPFNFMRKRHNCYNCGLGFCKVCSSAKSLKAALAPSVNKPYRVCDDCFAKLQKNAADTARIPHVKSVGSLSQSLSLSIYNKASELQGNTSRLSFAETFKIGRVSTFDSRMFPLQRPSSCSKSPSSSYGSAQSSPLLFTTPSPHQSRTPEAATTFDTLRSINDSLSMEVKTLRTQVEKLTSKNQNLAAELDRRTKQLKEMSGRAAEELEKSKAAKEVIKSLTAQIKEMAQRVSPEKQVARTPLEQTSGSESSVQRGEQTVQDEPGVYITLLSSSSGFNELRRVRFSRRHFTEEQAEKWWAQNGSRLCERHNIRTMAM